MQMLTKAGLRKVRRWMPLIYALSGTLANLMIIMPHHVGL